MNLYVKDFSACLLVGIFTNNLSARNKPKRGIPFVNILEGKKVSKSFHKFPAASGAAFMPERISNTRKSSNVSDLAAVGASYYLNVRVVEKWSEEV